MASTDEEVQSILSLIESTKLPHPSDLLLRSYVREALNPLLAARYVKDRLQLGEASSLVDDWIYIIESVTQNGCPPPQPDATEQQDIIKRDRGKCCITGKAGTLCDPLIVAPILPVPSGWNTDRPNIRDMLNAFFGPPYWAWWLSYIKSPRDVATPYHNRWLIRKSAAGAYSSGHVRLDRLRTSMIEYELRYVQIGVEEPIEVDGRFPLLGDYSRSYITKVDPRFVGSHARLCESIQLVKISKSISKNISKTLSHKAQPSSLSIGLRRQHFWAFSTLCKGAFLTVWLWIPSKVRMRCYEMLQNIGKRLYGKPWYDDTETIQRLPFGLYLKCYSEADLARNEFNALKMVRQHTSIPVPQAVDVILEHGDPNDPSSYLLMTEFPGLPLSRCQYVLSEMDIEQIANQLKNYIAQLRDIPRLPKSDFPICNTLGEACRDHRIRHADAVGPFADEAAFSQFLRFSDDPARRGHRSLFAHADLNPRNILVDQTVQSDGTVAWNITGIVDWETAGYYPEYWEYTKAMLEGFRWLKRYNDMIHNVFSEFGDYSKEMVVERRSWETGDAV